MLWWDYNEWSMAYLSAQAITINAPPIITTANTTLDMRASPAGNPKVLRAQSLSGLGRFTLTGSAFQPLSKKTQSNDAITTGARAAIAT